MHRNFGSDALAGATPVAIDPVVRTRGACISFALGPQSLLQSIPIFSNLPFLFLALPFCAMRIPIRLSILSVTPKSSRSMKNGSDFLSISPVA
jgi:membrane protein insertase Oxa1/YidC/SpoIIIJ